MKKRSFQIFQYSCILGLSCFFLLPLIWMLSTSFKQEREVFSKKGGFLPELPKPQSISPYQWKENSNNTADSEIRTGDVLLKKLQNLTPEEQKDPARLRTLHRFALGKIQARLLDGRIVDLEKFSEPKNGTEKSAWVLSSNGWMTSNPLLPSEKMIAYSLQENPQLRLQKSIPFDPSYFAFEEVKELILNIRGDESWNTLQFKINFQGESYESKKLFPMSLSGWQTVSWMIHADEKAKNKVVKSIAMRKKVLASPQDSSLHLELQMNRSSFAEAIFQKFTWNYYLVFRYIPFWLYLKNSLLLILLNVLGTLLSCSLVAYSFARIEWRGKTLCMSLLLLTLMVPPQVLVIPQFVIMQKLGFYNTLTSLWITSLFANAFFVYLLYQFMKGIPKDLDEAATIDGCGHFRIYWHVMIPLLKPSLSAVALFTFINTWNDFMTPLIYLRDQSSYPLSLGIYALNVQSMNNIGLSMAGSMLMTIPIIIVFLFAQRQFIQSVAFSGIK